MRSSPCVTKPVRLADLYGLMAVALVAGTAAAQPPPIPTVVQPQVSDVELLTGKSPGARIVQFKVAAPKGAQFFVDFRTFGIRGAAGVTTIWEKSNDDPAAVTVTIDYNLGFAGDANVNVFLSREEALSYKVDAKGTRQGGISGLASAPLFTLAPDERTIDFIAAPTDRLAFNSKGQRRLLFVTPKLEIGKDPETILTRTELVVGAYVEPPPRKPSEANQLASRWWRQPREVGSAHIKYRLRRSGPGSYLPLKPEEVQKFLDEADLEKHPENFAAVLRKVLTPERQKQLWSEGEFYSLGLKTRDRTGTNFDRAYDSEFDLKRMSEQIDVVRGEGSTWHRATITDFRLENPITDMSLFEQEAQPPDQLLLRRDADGRRFEVLADWATGFVRRVSFVSGTSISQRLQFAPQRYPGGIVFPTLKMEISYRDNELDRLDVTYIDHAEFNEPLPSDAFQLAAAQDARVILHEGSNQRNGKFVRLPKAVPDLAAYLRELDSTPRPK
jgi:hypothetical protein